MGVHLVSVITFLRGIGNECVYAYMNDLCSFRSITGICGKETYYTQSTRKNLEGHLSLQAVRPNVTGSFFWGDCKSIVEKTGISAWFQRSIGI